VTAGGPAVAAPAWAARRRRAAELRERLPFAAEVLTLELALLDVQEPAHEAAAARPPEPAALLRTAVHDLLPRVVEATVAAGPAALADAVVGRFHGADLDDLVARWLRGADQAAVDRYLARAVTAPLLAAAAPDALAALCPGPRGARLCPRCGGPPQLSFAGVSDDPMVTAPRQLLCARCAAAWVHPRMICPSCGAEDPARLTVYADAERLPQLRVEGCAACRRYLVGVDARRDPAAVPVVDELAALPLDLFARERGLRKVVPNHMGM
jgi:hypothetical protein